MTADILNLSFIFFARVAGISCNVVRILAAVKGRRLLASCLGFFETMLYMLIIGRILGGGRALALPELLCYSGGFATGNYVGAWLEERLLNSLVLVEAIVDYNEAAGLTVDKLRAAGVGATVINGMGRSGPKLVVKIFCSRRDVVTIQKFFAGHSFVTISDIKRCIGGWFSPNA